MKALSIVKAATGAGAAFLLAGFLAAPAAQAGGGKTVPCNTGKLIAAINAANTAGGGTINLTPWCHYKLTAPIMTGSEDGLPPVITRIAVNGNRATIDGTGAVRVFEVDGPGGNLWLNNVRITGGSADNGGGIANLGGMVTLNFSTVTRNTAADAGGGIAIATGLGPPGVAKLTLNFSRVTDNSQTAGPASQNSLGGGGIASVLGKVTLNSSQVSGNSAMGFVGGGIASGDYIDMPATNPSSLLILNNSRVTGNTAPNAGGGGIQNLLGTVIVNYSKVNGNTSLNGGGISSGNGNGGIPPGTSHLTLNGSQVNGNTATAPVPQPGPMSGPPIAAGGIANGGVALLKNTQVDNNTASVTSGGGIVNHGQMTLINCRVNGNAAAGSGVLASGGGIISAQGEPGSAPTTLTIINSLVAFNRAGGDGGGIANGVPLPPGGPMLVGGALKLVNSLVIGNKATAGGGIFNNHGTVTLLNALIIGNHPDNCEPTGTITGCKN
jgi:hypothetical protein